MSDFSTSQAENLGLRSRSWLDHWIDRGSLSKQTLIHPMIFGFNIWITLNHPMVLTRSQMKSTNHPLNTGMPANKSVIHRIDPTF